MEKRFQCPWCKERSLGLHEAGEPWLVVPMRVVKSKLERGRPWREIVDECYCVSARWFACEACGVEGSREYLRAKLIRDRWRDHALRTWCEDAEPGTGGAGGRAVGVGAAGCGASGLQREGTAA